MMDGSDHLFVGLTVEYRILKTAAGQRIRAQKENSLLIVLRDICLKHIRNFEIFRHWMESKPLNEGMPNPLNPM